MKKIICVKYEIILTQRNRPPFKHVLFFRGKKKDFYKNLKDIIEPVLIYEGKEKESELY